MALLKERFIVLFSADSPEIEGGGWMREKDRKRKKRKASMHCVIKCQREDKSRGEGGGGHFQQLAFHVNIFLCEFSKVKELIGSIKKNHISCHFAQ